MKKFFNQVMDLPKMINGKLPMNKFNLLVDESEQNIAKWVGTFYTVSAIVILITSILSILLPIWSGEMGIGLDILGNVLSILIWLYAAFPIAQFIRSAGDSLAESKNGIVDFVFRDFVVTNIKLIGKVTALITLFGAFCMTISWATSVNVSSSFSYNWINNISSLADIPMKAAIGLSELLRLEMVTAILSDVYTHNVWETSATEWSLSGFYAVTWQYVGVVVILAKLYVSVAIYNFFYGIAASFVNWLKSPYFPFKAK